MDDILKNLNETNFTAHSFGEGLTFLALPGDEVIDWKQVIIDISQKSISLRKIAEHVGVGQSKVKGWRYFGHRILFEDALPLAHLWTQLTQNPAELLPKIEKKQKRHR